MKHILLLTDYSKNSINAMRYALQLFEHHICKFYLLHVQSSSTYTTDDLILAGNASVYSAIVKKAKHKLSKLVTSLEKEVKHGNFSFETLIDYDALTDAITQVVVSKNINLIVMGSNGVTGAKEVIFGSNTINVIRKVDCPTLVIPEKYEYKKPNDVLLPLDVPDSTSGMAFTAIVEFTEKFCKTLHILRIQPDAKNSKEEKRDRAHLDTLKQTNYVYHKINNVPIPYVVACYSQTHNIDLIALIAKRESLFDRFFSGSPTTQITHKIKVPLLVSHS
ncbi:nucleotide-binding universal stress UspA family protein [Jejuia pallidilutea]|uniref:Nucleotide-binding universal stress UspA family protein n=1 Tax=Jejuia pallidilutea TaxID=504487 RepID=A0A362X201_9FLAO|nr:universal stress protein [Jejuia pallidilutea]PQV50436.1 nucleotide-binding universal stress UspA family protein [Jejuia pallidilutea]